MVRKSPLPPYLSWRQGRPRWEPGPKLRAAGYRGQDLKYPDGRFMTLADAIGAAEALNQAVAQSAAQPRPAKAHTFDELFALFMGTPEKPSPRWKDIAPRTQKDYRQIFAQLSLLLGDRTVGSITRAEAKGLYTLLQEEKGLARANAIIRVARLAVNHAMQDLEWREITSNRFAGLKLGQTEGRLVMWEPEEVAAFVACADWLDCEDESGHRRRYESMGDAVILGLCTGQNRGDVIAARDFVAQNGVYVMRRAKTGRDAFIPRSKTLDSRLAMMAARKAERWPGIAFKSALVSSRLGTPYPASGDHFQKEFFKVRAVAAGVTFALEDFFDALAGRPPAARNLPFTPQPSLLDKNFQDLRDTAVTALYEELGDIAKVCTVTGHSLKTGQDIIEKHYWVRRGDTVKSFGHIFDDFMNRRRG